MVKYFYFDTSALVKHYIAEIGSKWVDKLLISLSAVVFTSYLTLIEGVCTFARRRREDRLLLDDYLNVLSLFDYDFQYRYKVIGVEPVVMDTARQLANRNPLRAYDAVQLATALVANDKLKQIGKPSLTFICADDRLLAIAQSEGLLTHNPNHHP